MRGLSALLVACGLGLAVPDSLSADTADYVGRPVSSVRLVLDGQQTDEPALAQLIETAERAPLSMVQVRETVTHLFSLGRFDDVRVDARMDPLGVALTYELTSVHAVSRIEFTGNLRALGVDESQLRRAMVDRYGTSPPLGRADELSRIVVDTLQERGYRQARVTPRTEPDRNTSRTVLTFTIDAGPRTVLGAITVAGAPGTSQKELLNRLNLVTGAPYEPDALNTRIAAYIESWRTRGHYEARVVPTVAFGDDGRTANLTLTVEPGPLVRVVFTGDPLPEATRTELVPIAREGSVDEDLLEDSSNRIEEYLRNGGYGDARAPHTRQQTADALVVTFDVRKGPHYRVSAVDIAGGAPAQTPDLRPSLRTRVGEPFSEANLDADITAIESVYRSRGFAGVRVQADPRPLTSDPRSAQVPVAVSLLISEGVRTVVGAVTFEGNAAVPADQLSRLLSLQPGMPYYATQLRRDTAAIEEEYANRGYRSATVQVQPAFTEDRATANLVFLVREGPQVLVDHVLIVGNVRTKTETIEREVQLKPGEPLSTQAAYETQRRLAALQLFRRTPQLTEVRHGDDTRRDVIITVEEADPVTIDFGGGVEGRVRVVSEEPGAYARQRFEIAPRAFVDMMRRNLFGSNRSINLFASVAVHLQGQSSASAVAYRRTEYRLLGTFREPRVFGTAADGLITGAVEQQIRSSFNLARQTAAVQVSRRLTPKVGISGGYQLQKNELLDVQLDPADQPLIDRIFTQVRVSSVSSQVFYDSRDDVVDSTHGEYYAVNGLLAPRSLGSEVGFAKAFFTAQGFRPAPLGRGSVFAAQARLGLATGFSRELVQEGDEGETIVENVKDVPEPERFFAGGDTTVRGFALDTLGRPDTIRNGFPIGGNGEVIVNFETRGPVYAGVQPVGFVDVGNVFSQASDIDFGLLRTALGFGVRYKSPLVGTIRFDLGFKVNPQPNEKPSAWFVTFGQAF